MSLPRKVARTGPSTAAIVIRYSFSAVRSIDWHPVMHSLSTAGSLSALHTEARSAGSWRWPASSMVELARDVGERRQVVHREQSVDVRAHGGDAGSARLEAFETQQ